MKGTVDSPAPRLDTPEIDIKREARVDQNHHLPAQTVLVIKRSVVTPAE
jgi:hypothetical protein